MSEAAMGAGQPNIKYFKVIEKVGNTGQTANILFGVSRDNVLRVDPASKAVLQAWPLTHIKRWAAAPNCLTVDFGDYVTTGYYIIQTTEASQISNLLSQYCQRR